MNIYKWKTPKHLDRLMKNIGNIKKIWKFMILLIFLNNFFKIRQNNKTNTKEFYIIALISKTYDLLFL